MSRWYHCRADPVCRQQARRVRHGPHLSATAGSRTFGFNKRSRSPRARPLLSKPRRDAEDVNTSTAAVRCPRNVRGLCVHAHAHVNPLCVLTVWHRGAGKTSKRVLIRISQWSFLWLCCYSPTFTLDSEVFFCFFCVIGSGKWQNFRDFHYFNSKPCFNCLCVS